MKTQELEVSISQNEWISLEQNIKSSCKKIQKVCKKETVLGCTKALKTHQVSEERILLRRK